jgi:hypothetical protein
MTGTACDLCEYDETETSCLNKFDLFSLLLFEKINNNQLQVGDKRRRRDYILTNPELNIWGQSKNY